MSWHSSWLDPTATVDYIHPGYSSTVENLMPEVGLWAALHLADSEHGVD